MRKEFSVLLLAVLMAVFSISCSGGQPVVTPSDDIMESALVSALPKTYDGELTIEFNFGTRTGHYSGDINENGLPHGYGVFSVESSTWKTWTYDGEWVDGHLEGVGTTVWANGQSYSGEYIQDEETGNGTLILDSGEKYEGTFDSLSIIGNGSLIYTDGTVFSGNFTDNDNAIGTYCDSEGFIYDAIIDDGELKLRPASDFFSDEIRQSQYKELYQSYQYTKLAEYVNAYLLENETTPLDSAYSILNLINPAIKYEGQWNIQFDDFDSKYILTFKGADSISQNTSVAVSVDDTWLDVKMGFRKNGWLFFDRVALSIDGQQVYNVSINFYDVTRNVISGHTIEEYCNRSPYDDVLEQLNDAETVILRFTNSDNKEIYDHTLTQNEIDALYCGLLLRVNNRDLRDLLYRYNNFSV